MGQLLPLWLTSPQFVQAWIKTGICAQLFGPHGPARTSVHLPLEKPWQILCFPVTSVERF